MKVRFTQFRQVLDHNGKPEATYNVGDVVEFEGASLERWLRRDCCEALPEVPEPPAKTVTSERAPLARKTRKRRGKKAGR